MEPWLDEALCTYTELLYYENRHPEALKWWWDYRVEYYQPQGWVDLSIYDADGYRTYRDAVYLNGMKFLLELRTLVGESVFAAFLQDYLAQNTHGLATSADFFTILRQHTETDWSLLKAKYFRYSCKVYGRRKRHHIPGGNINSPLAIERAKQVKLALDSNWSYTQIRDLVSSF